MKISIIVPIYRAEKYLPRCIESILSQTFTDFELILVDDGSPDRCGLICDEAAKKDARIRVIHQPNQGVAAARNAGLDAARGKWLGFVDADDFVAPRYLEALCRAAVRYDEADCVMCSSELVDRNGEPMDTPAYMSVSDGTITGRSVLEKIDQQENFIYLVPWNKIYRREVWKNIRYPKGRRNEDAFVFAEIFDTIQTVAYAPEKLYFYRQSEQSIMRSEATLKHLDEMWAFVNCYQYFEEHGMEELMPLAEKRIFGKLTNLYYDLPKQQRRSDEIKQAKQVQWSIDMQLMKRGQMNARTLARTLLFQILPGVYGLRKQRYRRGKQG